MNELNVNVEAKQGEISFNLDELKKNLSAEMEHYKNLVVTEESLKADKKDLAMLRKAYKELNDRKIAVKKSFMQPYADFEEDVKEALAIINEPIEIIDRQIKAFEEDQKKAKKEHCREIYDGAIGEFADYLPFEKLFREDWLKASVKDKDIVGDIDIAAIRVKNDLNAIKLLSSEIESEIIDVYKRTGELSAAIQRNTDYINAKELAKKQVEEEKRKQEVQKDEKVEPSEKMVTNKETVCFRVSGEHAEKVRQFFRFSAIEYEEV